MLAVFLPDKPWLERRQTAVSLAPIGPRRPSKRPISMACPLAAWRRAA
jgi:hypothetical protein